MSLTTTKLSSFILVVLLLIVVVSTIIHTSTSSAAAAAAAAVTANNENNNDSFSSSVIMKSQYHHHPQHPLLSTMSSLQLSPVHHFHDAFLLNRLLLANRFASIGDSDGDNDLRNLQQEGDDNDDICTNDPFLWSIHRRQDSSTILGFGIGTIHFPIQYILDDQAWELIQYAIDDSCYVYGEIDFLNEQIMLQLQTCSIEIGSEGTIYLADLINNDKDKTITNQISDGITEILNEYIPIPSQRPAIQQVFEDTLPIWVLLQFIQVYKTSSDSYSTYKDSYFQSQFVTGVLEPIMDYSILELANDNGGYTGSIEHIDTQCKVLDMLSPNRTEFWNDYDNHWKLIIEHSLNNNTNGYTPLLDGYKCGNIQQFTNWLLNDASNISGSEYENDINQFLFDERNIQMGEFIVDKLNKNNQQGAAPPSVFVVGLGHWTYGEYNLVDYLEENGYTLQRITLNKGNYNQDTYPNMSNEICDDATTAPTISPTLTSTTKNSNNVEQDVVSMSGDTTGTTTTTTTTATATANNNEDPNDKSSSSASGPFDDCYSHHQAIISGIVIAALLFQQFA